MPRSASRAILFDFSQTLVDSSDGFRRAEKEAQRQIFADLSLTDWNAFLEQYRPIREQARKSPELSRSGIWRDVYRHFGRDADPQCLDRWERDYWACVAAHTSPFPEAEHVLTRLSATYALGLLSNVQGPASLGEQRHSLERFPKLRSLFKVALLAGENGVPPKPDPIAFHACLRQLGICADDAAFVGDDWQIDICGAQHAGLRAIWLQHHSLRRNWPAVDAGAVPIISSLEPLLDMPSIGMAP